MTAVRTKPALVRPSSLSRRSILRDAFASMSGVAISSVAAPLISYASSRPTLTHGLQTGDITHDGAVIWARTDRPARMLVEASTSETFQSIRASAVVDAFPETDFTAKVALDGFRFFYRVRFQDHATPTINNEPQTGSFRTAPLEPHTVSFVWSGDAAGQGFGIDHDRARMRTFSTMLKHEPDFLSRRDARRVSRQPQI